MPERIVFMGSPDFAVPTLRFLAGSYQVRGVVTQPDRPAGRGKTLTPPPVKIAAEEYDLEVMQPDRLKDEGVFEHLQEWSPDVIVVAAFGQILRKNVLDLPRFGCINVHASLLPRWRGAAPIQAAILAGDLATGVSIMKMDAGIDTGGVLMQCETRILEQDTTLSLGNRLAEMGAEVLKECLPGIFSGDLTAIPQDETKATHAPKIEKHMSMLDFSLPAPQLERMVRAFFPWPGSQITIDDLTIKVLKVHVNMDGRLTGGKRGIIDGLPAIGTCEGDLVFDELQPAGKKPMPGRVFLNGHRNWEQ